MYCDLLKDNHVVMILITGWIAVQRDVMIDFSLEQYSLVLKTDSTLGSMDKVRLYLYTSQGNIAGGLILYFNSTPQYYIWSCSSGYTNFPTNLPPGKDKVWRVTLTRTAGIRLVVHCNEEEVLNILMSDSTCANSNWSAYWSKELAKIKFHSDDTASDYYQPQPGSCVF